MLMSEWETSSREKRWRWEHNEKNELREYSVSDTSVSRRAKAGVEL
jgi:hypothetical protein